MSGKHLRVLIRTVSRERLGFSQIQPIPVLTACNMPGQQGKQPKSAYQQGVFKLFHRSLLIVGVRKAGILTGVDQVRVTVAVLGVVHDMPASA